LLVGVLFLPLILGADFVYDDVEFVGTNPELGAIKSLADCFRFKLQPSKPVTSFTMAIAQWAGGGSVLGHRLVSLSLHLAVCTLLFLNLLTLSRKLGATFSPWVVAAVTFLYAIHPLHTETVGVAQFRGEILGTLFALGAIYALLRESRSGYLTMFLLLGFSQLSKEAFAIFLPALLITVYALTGKSRREILRFAGAVVVAEILWAVVLFFLIRRDAGGYYTYETTIGWNAVSPAKHLALSARAILEGLTKFFFGQRLVTTPLSERGGIGHDLSWMGQALVVILSAVVIVFAAVSVRDRRFRLATIFLGFPFGVYLAIPNLNIGSEHYWYFPLMGGVGLASLVIGCAANRTRRPRMSMLAAFSMVAIIWGAAFESRSLDYRNRREFYEAELATHPESSVNWVGVGAILLADGAPDSEVSRHLTKALELDPENVRALLTQYYLHSRRKDLPKMDETITQLLRKPFRKRVLASVFLDYAGVSLEKSKCGPGKYSLDVARQLDPDNPDISTRMERFLSEIQIGTQRCADLALLKSGK